MTLLGIPFGWMLLGLGALAALLYVLQRLRVRHQEIPVVTTMFWKAAVEETRARVLTRRFKHPLAYALVLAIAGLLWIAMADPVVESKTDTAYVLLLDGSAGMARQGRFEAAREALLEAVDDMPRESRQVLFCGATVRPLLVPGEDVLVLEKRLEGLAPEPAPATVEDAVRRIAAASGPAVVRIFGDAPLGSFQGRDGLRVERAPTSAAPTPANGGITAIGVSEAASGSYDRVDVLVEVRGRPPALPFAVWGGSNFTDSTGEQVFLDATTRRHVFSNLAANGDTFTVEIREADDLTIDDRASVVLPTRRLIRVALSPALEAQFGPLLAADRAVVLDAAAPDIALRVRGEAVGGGVPALEIVPARDQTAAFHVTDPDAADDADAALLGAAEALSLSEIDAHSLAETAGRTIEVSVESGPRRGVSIWQELLGEPYDFVPSRAFPVFVARAVRWLAGVPEIVPFAVAGEPIPYDGRVETEDGTALDALGVAFVPDRAQSFRLADGRTVAASLADPSLAGAAPTDRALAPSDDPGGSTTLVTWILLLAFGLVFAEWHFFRTGRIP